MKISKTRLEKAGLKNLIQFEILSRLVCLHEYLQKKQDKEKPLLIFNEEKIQGIFQRTGKIFRGHLNHLALQGYISWIPLKPGGHEGKISECAVFVLEKAGRVVHKEFNLEHKIQAKQDQYRREFEDFRY